MPRGQDSLLAHESVSVASLSGLHHSISHSQHMALSLSLPLSLSVSSRIIYTWPPLPCTTLLKLGKKLPPSIQPRGLELRHSSHYSAITHYQMQRLEVFPLILVLTTEIVITSVITVVITTVITSVITVVITTVITTVIITVISQHRAPTFQRRAPTFQRHHLHFSAAHLHFSALTHCQMERCWLFPPNFSSYHQNMLWLCLIAFLLPRLRSY